ncbi:hypothetical protein BVG16_19450 [Paenibacillus selenitireducens]|uniref:Uncharacterized protein n=1 Tax=Paenibacillus selenitireducens TaxID=1324314 RepID=A0A1T2X6L5_9BACL|nr:DUF58 domain-containing protein [Paenibacillus selenitireducens]OPA75527.1 hypothetical protein BVG16_19450 [Paenibacillus selenitireducens]
MSAFMKGLAALALWSAAMALALLRNGTVEWFLFTVFSCLFGWGLLIHTLALRSIRVERRLERDRIHAGDRFVVTMTVTIRSWIPLLWIMITDRIDDVRPRSSDGDDGEDIPRFAAEHTRLFMPGFRQQFTYAYRIGGLERGRYPFAPLEVKTGDLFGWFTKKKSAAAHESFLIYPARIPWTHWLTGYTVPSLTAEHSMQRLGVDSPSLGSDIREYVHGDPWKRIHWKSSAKQGRWQLRLPDQEGKAYTCFVFDAASGHHPRFEMAVAWTVARLEQLLTEGTEISFVGHQADGRRTHWMKDYLHEDMMRYFAELQPEGQASLLTAVRHTAMREPRETTFIIVSERLDRETAEISQWLTSRGFQLEWVWIMAQDILSQDEQEWMDRVQRVGGLVYRIEPRRVRLPAHQGGAEDVSA